MGCLSSKLMISRSLSYREDFHMVSDHSKNRNENLLSLLNKLQNSGSTSAAAAADDDLSMIVSHDHKDREITDHVFDLRGGLDLEPETTSATHGRSKSCRFSPENESPRESNLRSGGSRSRSFHTVEEYDALLEKIRMSSGPHETDNSHSDEVGDRNTVDIADKQVEDLQSQRGWKKVGKRLGSLEVPPATVSFRQINSSGGSNYVTPKFGSYNLPPSKRIPFRGGGEEERIDDLGELVAAFEECMLQLQVEEDNLIKKIDEGEPAFLTRNHVG